MWICIDCSTCLIYYRKYMLQITLEDSLPPANESNIVWNKEFWFHAIQLSLYDYLPNVNVILPMREKNGNCEWQKKRITSLYLTFIL